jgi:signal transduction histidine kinase
MLSDGAALTLCGSRDFMRSLRGWLLILWLMLVISAVVTGYLLIASFRQSAAAQVGRAQELVARSCRDIADRYSFATTGWNGPSSSQIDQELRQRLTIVVAVALASAAGVEGGIWQSQAGSLAYAFPTYEGTGPKTDLPEAEHGAIEQVNADARRDEQPVTVRRPSETQTLVLQACPLTGTGSLSDVTAWTMTRVFTGSGSAYRQLVAGLGILVLSVIGSALWLGWIIFSWSRRIGRLEHVLQHHETEELPTLEKTGARELDRLVEALNATGQRLSEARRRAAAAERLAALGRLAAGIAHEIRNPIAAMRLKAENALPGADDRRDAALRTILDQIARLDVLLRNLLTMTHPPDPCRASTDIAKLLEECGDAHRELATAKNVRVEVARASQDIGTVGLDREQTRRALDNLILNAIQSTPSGGCVRLSVQRDDTKVRFRVADSGPGVPEALRDHLFEPFVTGRADGTGLGLAIVREIARAHDGEASLLPSSEGALFEVELPWRRS